MPVSLIVASFVAVFLLGYLVGSESDEVRSRRAVLALVMMAAVLMAGMIVSSRLP